MNDMDRRAYDALTEALHVVNGTNLDDHNWNYGVCTALANIALLQARILRRLDLLEAMPEIKEGGAF